MSSYVSPLATCTPCSDIGSICPDCDDLLTDRLKVATDAMLDRIDASESYARIVDRRNARIANTDT